MITLSESLNTNLLNYLNSSCEEMNKDINLNNIKIEKFSSKYKSHLKEINKLESHFNNSSSLDELNKKPSYVFIENNNLIGYVEVSSRGKEHSYIESFIVKPEYRGKGVGKYCFELLLKFIKDQLKSKVVSLGVLVDNTPARSLYYSFGFKLNILLLRGYLKIAKNKSQVEKANTESLKQLKQLYIKVNKGLDKLEEDCVPKSSFVLIKDNEVVAGSGYTVYKKK